MVKCLGSELVDLSLNPSFTTSQLCDPEATCGSSLSRHHEMGKTIQVYMQGYAYNKDQRTNTLNAVSKEASADQLNNTSYYQQYLHN